MRTLIALAALLAVGPFAGSDALAGPPADLAGAQAIQFTVDNNFTVSAFQGQMISYQRFLTDKRAVRLAAGLYLDRTDSDVSKTYDDDIGERELLNWDNSFTVKAQYVFYRGDGAVRYFWGAGPKVTYGNSRSETSSSRYEAGNVEFILYGYDNESFGAGLQGFCGVEWFINDLFSLHAEYAVSAMYTWTRRFEERAETWDPESYESYTSERRSPSFSSDGVRFGLSARF